MPELPEVETVMRGLTPVMAGMRITALTQNRPDLRFPLPERFAARLTGRRIEALSRRAKYILMRIEGGDVLLVHLGMTGRFTISGRTSANGAFTHDAGGDPKHDHVVFDMSSGARVTFNDARRFGYMDLIAEEDLPTHRLIRDLGVEPLSDDLSAAYIADKAAGRRADLKAFLMDQHVIAGLGNIYVSEALFRARLDPERLAGSLVTARGLPGPKVAGLVTHVRDIITEAIAAGGSSLRDYVQASGELGYFQKAHRVYDRAGERCVTKGCTGVVRRIVQSGRATFFCPRCQR